MKRRKVEIGDILIYLLMILIGIITIYPFLNVLAISLNDSMDTLKGGVYLWPRKFTLENYRQVLKHKELLQAFKNSVTRTVVGSLVGVISTTMIAYVLTRKDFIANKLFSTLFALTLYIDAGMIPNYILIKKLGLINKFSVYIIPNLIGVFYIYIVKAFIEGLPFSLQESAQIDGANDFTIFTRIVFPLCKPVIATITLYYAVSQWNSWLDTYLYAASNQALTTLQYELMKILNASTNVTAQVIQAKAGANNAPVTSPQSIRMAITIVSTVPILIVYPFLQKYFVQGMTLGAVKD